MSERLEQIKTNNYHVSISDVKWLIEQAEKVEGLELELSDWKDEVRKWQQLYEESEESQLETKELLYSTLSEIYHYREILKEIARGRFPGASYKARQALKGEK